MNNPKRMACEDNIYLAQLEEQKKMLPSPKSKPVPMPDKMKILLHKLQKAAKQKQSLEDFRAEIKTTIPD